MKLFDFLKNYLTNNIFYSLSVNSKIDEYPKLKALLFNGEETSTQRTKELDLLYKTHSGLKNISNYLTMLCDEDVSPSIADRELMISDTILIKYGSNWEHILNAYLKQYEPLENYDMHEDENQNTNITITTNGDNNTFGFNTESEDGIPASKSEITQTTDGKFNDNYRQLHRHGNVGVTTSQQMLLSELSLRSYDVIERMFTDLDDLFTRAYRYV